MTDRPNRSGGDRPEPRPRGGRPGGPGPRGGRRFPGPYRPREGGGEGAGRPRQDWAGGPPERGGGRGGPRFERPGSGPGPRRYEGGGAAGEHGGEGPRGPRPPGQWSDRGEGGRPGPGDRGSGRAGQPWERRDRQGDEGRVERGGRPWQPGQGSGGRPGGWRGPAGDRADRSGGPEERPYRPGPGDRGGYGERPGGYRPGPRRGFGFRAGDEGGFDRGGPRDRNREGPSGGPPRPWEGRDERPYRERGGYGGAPRFDERGQRAPFPRGGEDRAGPREGPPFSRPAPYQGRGEPRRPWQPRDAGPYGGEPRRDAAEPRGRFGPRPGAPGGYRGRPSYEDRGRAPELPAGRGDEEAEERTRDLEAVQAATPSEFVGADEELIAGRRPVEEAFAARRPARRLLVVPQRREALDALVVHATVLRIPVVEVEGGTLTSLAGFDGHQGVALVVEPRRWATLDDVLARALSRGEPPFVLVLDSLEDPQNLGTVLRSAEACGVHGVVFPTRNAAPLTPAAVKTSAGAVEHLLLVPVDDLPGTLVDLHGRGLHVVGTDAEAALSYRDADLRGPLALVVGSEGHGLGGPIRRRLEYAVRIPMRGHVASLNAAVAGSVLLFEAAAQRPAPTAPQRDERPGTGAAAGTPAEPPVESSAAQRRAPARKRAAPGPAGGGAAPGPAPLADEAASGAPAGDAPEPPAAAGGAAVAGVEAAAAAPPGGSPEPGATEPAPKRRTGRRAAATGVEAAAATQPEGPPGPGTTGADEPGPKRRAGRRAAAQPEGSPEPTAAEASEPAPKRRTRRAASVAADAAPPGPGRPEAQEPGPPGDAGPRDAEDLLPE